MPNPENKNKIEKFQLILSGAAAITLFTFGGLLLNEGINKHDSANVAMGAFGILISITWAERLHKNIKSFIN